MKSTFVALIFMQGVLSAQALPNYLDLSLGYRNDRLSNTISARDADGDPVLIESLKAHGLNVYEIGAKVRYEPFCNIFGRGKCYVGYISGESYYETDTILGSISDIRARIKNGQTIDWDLECGYQFSYRRFIGVAPIFGWSYNKEQIQIRDPLNNGFDDPSLQGMKYTSSWNGPFVALDFFFNAYNFLINTGYEYHWSHWRGRYQIAGPYIDETVFSNTRRSHNAYGNVFYIDVLWNYGCGWSVGVSYSYKNFSTRGGDWSVDNSTFADVGLAEVNKTDVPKATWNSNEVTFDIRYSF